MPPSLSSPDSIDAIRKLMAHHAHPFSLERIRRQVLLRLHVLEKHVTKLTEKWLKNRVVPTIHATLKDELADTIATVLTKVGAKGFATLTECRKALESCKSNKRIRERHEFFLLLRMCESVDAFDAFMEKCQKALLVEYNEHLNKYCLSFFPDAGSQDLSSVQNYERQISEKQKEIEETLKRMNKLAEQYEESKRTFNDFLKNYEEILTLIEEFSGLVLEIGEPMKEWVFLDREYPRKLLLEVGELNQMKVNIADDLKKKENDLEFTERKLCRRTWQRKQFEEFVQEQKYRLRSTKQRNVAITSNLEKTEQFYQMRKKQLAEMTLRLETRHHSPKAHDRFFYKHIQLEEEVYELEERIDLIKKQRQNLYDETDKLTKCLQQNHTKLEKMQQTEEKVVMKMNKAKQRIKEIRDRARGLGEKVAVLKRIREIKLHPETVRRIRLHGYYAGAMDHVEDPLDAAFRLVARNIGKSWSNLYMKLPFDPDRDYSTRNEDLRVIDLSNQRLDCDIRESVIKSLRKWNRLSHTASLGQLVHTLKQIKRADIVNTLQEKVMVST